MRRIHQRYTYHVQQKHCENETKEDEEESTKVSEVENYEHIRGSRAAAQKYVKCLVHICVCLYVCGGITVLNILHYNKIFFRVQFMQYSEVLENDKFI